MNNSITILVDSVFAECISSKKTELSSTPFIDELSKNSIVADNIYSYGPYTDAATIGLYNGIKTCSNFGYYYGINSSEYSHFRVFHENGYETYGLFYPYYLLSSKVRQYIDHPIYTGGFKYRSVWEGKFEYYAKLKNKRNLTQFEYQMMEKCMEMVFDCWLGFYDDLENKKSDIIVKTLYDESIKGQGKARLIEESKVFEKNKRAYIDNLLILGMDHPLAKINEFDYGKECDKMFLEEIYKRQKKFLRKLEITNFFHNIINNPFSIKKIIRGVYNYVKTKNKACLRYIGNYGMLLLSPQMMRERSLKSRNWQEMASLDKQINVMFKSLDERKQFEKPFYASLHVLEPHHNISFFSFDSFNQNQIDEEFEYLKPLLNKSGRKFKGNLLYQLSLGYVDLCIKKLFEGLKERNLLDNTTVTLVADHGSSYFFDPVRTHVVNTFHKENYNIPLLIYNKKLPKDCVGLYDGFYMSEDIMPTLFAVNGMSCPKQMNGKVIYEKNSSRPFVITEYMGPGVPDMVNREVWMSVRNENYVVAYIASLNDNLNVERPFVFYNLKNDPKELKNLASCLDIKKIMECCEIKEMVEALKKRFDEIRNERDVIVSNFQDFNVVKKVNTAVTIA